MLYGKDSGRQGKVLVVTPKTSKVLVEGLNTYKRHLKGDGRTKVSEIVTITKSVPVDKVMLVCPECSKPTRVGYKVEKDTKVRVCKKCGKSVDIKVEEKKEEPKKETKKKATSTKKKSTTKKSTVKKTTKSKTSKK